MAQGITNYNSIKNRNENSDMMTKWKSWEKLSDEQFTIVREVYRPSKAFIQTIKFENRLIVETYYYFIIYELFNYMDVPQMTDPL